MREITPELIVSTFSASKQTARDIHAIIIGAINPLEIYPFVQAYAFGLVDDPADIELKMFAIQQLIQGYSVESVFSDEPDENGEQDDTPLAYYINVGAKDHPTFIYDVDGEEWRVMSINDFLSEDVEENGDGEVPATPNY
jgi:hypothetical protein